MKKTSVIFILLFAYLSTGATIPPPYPAATIPQELRAHADAVVRESRYEFDIRATDAATYRVYYAVTVLNKNGDPYAPLVVFYDKQHKVKNIRYEVFDATGELIKKVKNRDIEDFSAVSSYSIFEDNRVRYYEHTAHQYPYTVVYSYEQEHDGLLHFPSWQPVAGYGLSVEQSSYILSSPPEMPFRYLEKNITQAPVKTTDAEGQRYAWSLQDLPAREQEPFQPPLSDLTPTVMAAPEEFSYEGYAGNMKTWESLGQWVYQLNQGRDQLSVNTQQEIKAMVANLTDTAAMVQRLYEHLQAKTRYVSIQLGIGGFQPFEATTVNQLGYGDCKALSNYMKALLRTVNIPAKYALVRAGENSPDINAGFPSMQFNHAILCVPTQRDTLWLECTSQTNPFNYLGDFTGDRHVLLIDEAGGHLVPTPAYPQNRNQKVRHATVSLDETGAGTLDIQTTYTGLLHDEAARLARETAVEQKKLIYQKTNLSNFQLQDAQYIVDQQTPAVTEKLHMKINGYASISGTRWFVLPNLMNRLGSIPTKSADRQADIVIRYGRIESDTVTFHFPEGMDTEYVPQRTLVESDFGEYTCDVQVDGNQLVYSRVLKINEGTFPAEQYPALVKFYEEVARADQEKMVLKKVN